MNRHAANSFTQIDNGVISRLAEIGGAAAIVFLVLARRANGDRECWPSVQTIAADAGVTDRCARQTIRRLESAGLVTIIRQTAESGLNRPNRYKLPPLSYAEKSAGGMGNKTTVYPEQNDGRGTEKSAGGMGNKTTDEQYPLNNTQLNKRGARAISAKKFTKPTLSEVTAYCLERRNSVDPEKWLDHYETVDWKVGRNRMKDWRASVRTWERNGYANGTPRPAEPIYDRIIPLRRAAPAVNGAAH